ncbi:hypothetical protein K457DRAFT_1326689 [Linnemannia elongata AG-77]|uniref:Uncharacterized protein n=1 Tax=Linnemannia elongata AG-77 TaxID=1314771 RepID=A0A197JAB7_9FUNG|nr:hypothetical protein K457DRAFT_1326689 [Linnemannia elongata AG-77]
MLLCLLSSSILLVGWQVIMIESTFLFWLVWSTFFGSYEGLPGQSGRSVGQSVGDKRERELTRYFCIIFFWGRRINPGVT